MTADSRARAEREKRRTELLSLLGDLPPDVGTPHAETRRILDHDGYVLEELLLDLNGMEPVPAYFAKPAKHDAPLPCILYHHAHGGDYARGKHELIEGSPLLQPEPYARALTASGFGVLCIDQWLFGQRSGRTESSLFKEMLWNGRVLWGMMIHDNLRALDYVCSRPEVDPQRMGVTGLSMGSTLSWWLAALDTRIAACADLCCLTDFHALMEAGGLDGHGIYYYVPSLLKHFTAAQINTLIAPRARLSLVGTRDPLTPVDGVERIDREVREAYASAGAPGAWDLRRYDTGHGETAEMRGAVLEFFQSQLHGPGRSAPRP